MSSYAGPARRGTRLTAFYVATWACLAAAAIVYLAILAIKPDMAAGIVWRILPAQPEPTQAQHTISRAMAELESVKETLGEVRTEMDTVKQAQARHEDRDQALTDLQTEMGEVRRAITGGDERDRSLAARLSAVEARQIASESATSALRTALQSSASPPAADGRVITGSVANRGIAVRELAATAPQPAEPNKTEPKAAAATTLPSFGAARVTATAPTKTAQISGPVGLQLGVGPSPDALRLSWLRISSSHKDVVQYLEPRYVQTTSKAAAAYRLIVGPLNDAAEAAQICAGLKSKKVTCSVTAFAGAPL